MTHRRWLLLLLAAAWLSLGCATVSAIARMNAEKAELKRYSSGSKSLLFIPMVHVGTPAFYEDVRFQVRWAKRHGYVLFYEYIDFDGATEEERRKVRKMTGFVPSPEGYRKLLAPLLEQGYVIQDNDMFLRQENDLDYLVDLSVTEVIAEYEGRYGPIVLTREDKETPLEERIEATIPKKQMKSVIVGYRNLHLAQEIQKSKHRKLVVLYGAEHEKGMLDELRRLDPTWKKE